MGEHSEKANRSGAERPKTRQAVNAMIWREGEQGKQFLLLQLNAAEAAEKPMGDEWHPAGGVKDNPDESDYDALVREAGEETGIRPEELDVAHKPIMQREWDAPYIGVPGFHFTARFYPCRYVGEERPFRLSREHDNFGWFYASELPPSTPAEAQEAIGMINSVKLA
jgi:8-oxo-dGTP pyrophosphatase MutT (NUDIX family)